MKTLLCLLLLVQVFSARNGTGNVFMDTMVAFRDRIDESYHEYQEELDKPKLLLMQKKGTLESLLNNTEAVMGRLLLEKLIRLGRQIQLVNDMDSEAAEEDVKNLV